MPLNDPENDKGYADHGASWPVLLTSLMAVLLAFTGLGLLAFFMLSWIKEATF